MAPSKQEKRTYAKEKSKQQPQPDNTVENLVIFNKVFTLDLANITRKAEIIESRDALDQQIVKESLEQLKSDHKPTFAIITLLTRLAKKHVRNFNMDSMATLRTIAEQLKMEPVQVLLHAKTFRFQKPDEGCHKGTAPWGFSLHFARKFKRGRVVPSIPSLETIVASLQLTFEALEEQVTESATATLTKVGRRQMAFDDDDVEFELDDGKNGELYLTAAKLEEEEQHQCNAGKRPLPINNRLPRKRTRLPAEACDNDANALPEEDKDKDMKDNATIDCRNYQTSKSNPTLSIHKFKSLDSLFWLHIMHRLQCLQFVAIVFGNALGKHCPIRKTDDFMKHLPQYEVDFTPFLSFSFQVAGLCDQRRGFLLFLVKICMTFPTIKSIVSYKKDLLNFWNQRMSQDTCVAQTFTRYLDSQVSLSKEEIVRCAETVRDHFRKDTARDKDCQPKKKEEVLEGLRGIKVGTIVGQDLADEDYWKVIQISIYRRYIEFGSKNNTDPLKKIMTNNWNREMAQRQRDKLNEKVEQKLQKIQQLNKQTTRVPAVPPSNRRYPSRAQPLKQKGKQLVPSTAAPEKTDGDLSSLQNTSDSESESEFDPESVSEFENNDDMGEDGSCNQDNNKSVVANEDKSGNTALSDPSKLHVEDDELTTSSTEQAEGGSIDISSLLQAAEEEETISNTSTPIAGTPALLHSTNRKQPLCSIPELKKNISQAVSSMRLASPKDLLAAGVDSELQIQADRIRYRLMLAAYEFYLANMLKKFDHQRVVNEPHANDGTVRIARGSVDFVIAPDVHEFIDPSNTLHVLRANSRILTQSKFRPKLHLQQLIAFLLEFGAPDGGRGDGLAFHVAQAGPQNAGGPVGMGNSSPLSPLRSLRKMLGHWLLYMWDCSNQTLRKVGKPGLAVYPGANRDFKSFFGIPESTVMGLQALTLKFQEVAPFNTFNKTHKDAPNCGLPNSSQTSAFDICVADSKTGKVYLLQMIANYRIHVTSKIFPFYQSLPPILENFSTLIGVLNQSYNDQIYKNKALPSEPPTALDNTNLYIDDSLEYDKLDIAKGTNAPSVHLDVIEKPIGFSRIFSLSPGIHALHEARQFLDRRQIAELCVVGALLNTCLRFYHVIDKLVKSARNGTFQFGVHPFNDWYRETMATFNGKWQGGPNPRYNSLGLEDIGTEFGEKAPDGRGDQRLADIVTELLAFIDWVDDQAGRDHPHQLPIPTIKNKMSEVLGKINKIAPNFKNFAFFRLQVFLTYAIGACLTKPGRHVRQMFFPSKGMASFDHATNSQRGVISAKDAEAACTLTSPQKSGGQRGNDSLVIKEEDFDLVMELVFRHFNLDFLFRDTMENGLCEGRPARSLELKEFIVRGIPIYDINNWGEMIRKRPGMMEAWIVVEVEWGD